MFLSEDCSDHSLSCELQTMLCYVFVLDISLLVCLAPHRGRADYLLRLHSACCVTLSIETGRFLLAAWNDNWSSTDSFHWWLRLFTLLAWNDFCSQVGSPRYCLQSVRWNTIAIFLNSINPSAVIHDSHISPSQSLPKDSCHLVAAMSSSRLSCHVRRNKTLIQNMLLPFEVTPTNLQLLWCTVSDA